MKKNQKEKIKKSNLVSDIRKIALHNVDVSPRDEQSLLSYLKRWWCVYYKRPYKDPLLLEYSFEELLLEYFEILYFVSDEEKQKAKVEEYIEESEGEDEEWLREEMGDDYMTSEEMKELLTEDKNGNT